VLLYVDSSVVLRTIHDVPERDRLRAWFDAQLAAGAVLVSSRLLRTEVIRVLRRDGRPPSDGAAVLDRVRLITLSDEVASVAESIQWHIKALDALHLATALLIGEPVTVVSHDATMKSVAAQLGWKVSDPVAEVV
jgi:uncharacterized protein